MFQTQQQRYNNNYSLRNNNNNENQNNTNNFNNSLNTYNNISDNKNPNYNNVYNTQHEDRIDSLFEACNNKNLINTNMTNYFENKQTNNNNNYDNNNINNNNTYISNNKNYNDDANNKSSYINYSNINNDFGNNNNVCGNKTTPTNAIEDLCNNMYIKSNIDSDDDKYNKNTLYNSKNFLCNNDFPTNNDYINKSIHDNYDINNYKNNNKNNNNNNNKFCILNKPTVLNVNRNLPPPTKPKPAKHPGARSRPLPEYLNFRKFSVPLLSPSPKVEVPTQSVDDTSKNEEMKRMKKRCGDEDGVDSSSVHQLLREGDEMSDYNLKRFRYTGRSNPSRVFMLLQDATGTTEENLNVIKPLSSRPPRHQEISKNKDDPDDVVEMSYVGKNIPSRTFINLQNAVIERDPYGSTELLDSLNANVNSSVKVVHLRNKTKNDIDENVL